MSPPDPHPATTSFLWESVLVLTLSTVPERSMGGEGAGTGEARLRSAQTHSEDPRKNSDLETESTPSSYNPFYLGINSSPTSAFICEIQATDSRDCLLGCPLSALTPAANSSGAARFAAS